MMIRNNEVVIINHKKIARIKREYGILTRVRRKNPYKSFPTADIGRVPNVLKREFITPVPDEVYSTDMTYLFYGRGQKAYLSATKDLATNEIVSYRLMRTPAVSQFTEEFEALFKSLSAEKRSLLLVHSDQGFQYTNAAFRELLSRYGVTQSMSRRGNCLDNAPIESFFGHFKDLLDLKRCETYGDVEEEINWAMNFYNNERPQLALNKKPPALYRGLINCFF